MFEKVRGIIAEKLSIDKEQITLESDFIDDLDIDSLDLGELVMNLEEELDMEISDEDIEKFKTVGDVVSYINNHHEE